MSVLPYLDQHSLGSDSFCAVYNIDIKPLIQKMYLLKDTLVATFENREICNYDVS